jgi:hexaprenyl-diphosphate synthase
MIHVATLLHDDVLDDSPLRRNNPSSPSVFGNKLSILAGDFLLARASLAVSRLGSCEVVELIASVLANLVEGEVMQMESKKSKTTQNPTSAGSDPELNLHLPPDLDPPSSTSISPEIFDYYIHKTYLKTASLIAKSCRAAVILGGCSSIPGWEGGDRIKNVAYTYGRNLGIAFQVGLPRINSSEILNHV